MKHCPECNRNYADPTVSFCLQDGAPLMFGSASEDPETAVLPVNLLSEAATRTFDAAPTSHQSDLPINVNRRPIAIVTAILLVGALGIGGYLYFLRSSPRQIDSIAVMPFVTKAAMRTSNISRTE